ncbi:MAG: ribosomal RNA small subunit methyltransferase A [Armatimonadetes bacterium]|nr:ribosomal RNA small subunit methyltransferase A [Armatimonadota bacterium]
MNLTHPAELKALLLRHGLNPSKKWGQHFLVSPNVVSAIVERATAEDSVIEVGPGPGVLTSSLSNKCRSVLAFEIDPVAVSALTETAPLARVVPGDVLNADLVAAFQEFPQPRLLVSNMPYNITGPLLEKFAAARQHFREAVLMMQLEVGRKILAQEGNSAAGALSIAMQAQFDIKKLVLAPAGAFFPPPKVESIVLTFTPRQEPVPVGFLEFVRAGFRQPRKTLANNLRGNTDVEKLEGALRHMGLSATTRPHQLGLAKWQILFQSLQ